MRPRGDKLAAMGMAVCLLALLVHPAAAGAATLAAALFLTPVLLFGLVLVPRSLWPAFDLEQRFETPALSPAALFQRPPPFSIL